MSLRCNQTARSFQLAASVLGVVLMHRAEALPALKVCIDQANPTAAMDARVARAALKTQGHEIQEVFFVGHGKEADDGFPVGRFAKLAQSECELIMGFPVDVSSPHLPPNVQSTPAYASTGFVLVERGDGASKELGELPKGSEVGIAQLNTWAGLLYSTHPNIVMHVYAEDADMLADLENHRITAALTWQPLLQAYEKEHAARHSRLRSHILPGAHMQWDLVALYAPASQEAAEMFGKGLDVLRIGGNMDALIKPYQAAVALERTTSAITSERCADPPKAAKSKARLPKPPALYTEAQATAGATAYFQNCSMCHGPLLDGQPGGYPGPALKGADFADPSYDFHVDEIFHFVAKLMPAATPGSLSNEQNVNIMAYILKQNGYPAGAIELTYDGAMKSKVPIRYYGK
ncbi:MAG TPA: c-type cytochrome [Rudaea sp.]|jgi:mono/diheme cytochrome c family protein|uniref:c-type cytochrome n=1 Tax=Rudaea sp. TaxID=2136325 RepID=UPI002F95FCFC